MREILSTGRDGQTHHFCLLPGWRRWRRLSGQGRTWRCVEASSWGTRLAQLRVKVLEASGPPPRPVTAALVEHAFSEKTSEYPPLKKHHPPRHPPWCVLPSDEFESSQHVLGGPFLMQGSQH